MERNGEVYFAFAGVPQAELEWNFRRRVNFAANQNFQKDFEALSLKLDSIDALATHNEESGHRIFDAHAVFLKGQCGPRAEARNPLA